jgi:hypothetical protein
MITTRKLRLRVAALSASILMAALTQQYAQAQGSCCGGRASHASNAEAADCHSSAPAVVAKEEPVWTPAHDGQIHKSVWHIYEVVYGPHETQVYVYDVFHHPSTARGIRGEVIMRVRSNGQSFRYPLRYMSPPDGRDYLSLPVDLTHVNDGDMDVYFDLANRPDGEEPTVRFTQTFVMNRGPGPVGQPDLTGAQQPHPIPSQEHSSARPAVALSEATAADQPAIQRQRICPVTQLPLGKHGPPIKVSVNGRELFVCCQGCVDKVLQEPDAYLQKIAHTDSSQR